MTSELKFDEDTQARDVATALSRRIQGKTILVTGVSPGGIGETTSEAFASGKPALLILASRTKANLDIVAAAIKKQYPEVNVKVVVVDLASQKSIRSAAEQIKKDVSRIDILVNNAAVSPSSRQWTAEHIEMKFGTNHIGPFLFTNLLMPLLKNAAENAVPGETRIINVSSGAHVSSPVRFSDYNFEGHPIPDEEKPLPPKNKAMNVQEANEDGYPRFIAYAQSKTANILFSLYLQQHLDRIASYALHPGVIKTNLSRDSGSQPTFAKGATPPKWKWKTLDGGSSTTLVAALDPALNEMKGLYLSDCVFQEPASHAKDDLLAERLWRLSERLVGEEFRLE